MAIKGLLLNINDTPRQFFHESTTVAYNICGNPFYPTPMFQQSLSVLLMDSSVALQPLLMSLSAMNKGFRRCVVTH